LKTLRILHVRMSHAWLVWLRTLHGLRSLTLEDVSPADFQTSGVNADGVRLLLDKRWPSLATLSIGDVETPAAAAVAELIGCLSNLVPCPTCGSFQWLLHVWMHPGAPRRTRTSTSWR